MRTAGLVAAALLALGLATILGLRAAPPPHARRAPAAAVGTPLAPASISAGAAGAVASGHVRDPQGGPVVAAKVCATPDQEVGLAPPTCAVSDGAGAYRLAGLRAGRYVLSASAAGFRPARFRQGGHAFVDLADGEARANLDL